MMREVDIDGNGRIDDVEFIQFARTLLNDRRQHPKTELEDALKVSLVKARLIVSKALTGNPVILIY